MNSMKANEVLQVLERTFLYNLDHDPFMPLQAIIDSSSPRKALEEYLHSEAPIKGKDLGDATRDRLYIGTAISAFLAAGFIAAATVA